MTVSAAYPTASSIAQEIKYVNKDKAANIFRRTRYSDNIWGPWTVGPIGALDPNNRVLPGQIVKGTTITTTVPTASDTDVQSMTLPAGTYIITSGIQFTEAFTSSYNHQIFGFGITEIPNPVYRGYGDRGGGDVITVTAALKGTRTLTVVVNQLSGSDKIVNRLNFTALRIS